MFFNSNPCLKTGARLCNPCKIFPQIWGMFLQPLQNCPSILGHVIDGKRVLGALDEIQEVKNAIEAYRLIPELDAFKEKDLLKAHGLIMKDLVKQAGHYRQEV